MSKKIKYTNEPLMMGERVADFLPPPSRLVKKEQTVKVTLDLTKKSVAFFKHQAAKQSVPYQRMLRSLIDIYAERHETTR
jgi:predicted DNA binding CopG/RHH family protein